MVANEQNRPASAASFAPQSITARALLLGDRIDMSGLERADLVSTAPIAFKVGRSGFAVLYKFGVVVLFGLSPLEENEFLTRIEPRVAGPMRGEDETLVVEVSPDSEDKTLANGRLAIKDVSAPRLLVISDALAKSVALARDERRVNAVFDTVEPFAARLAAKGRPPGKRRTMLELIGQTLLVQHRVSGRVAVEDKPDVLWDRPDLERLYARLEDEYELETRSRTLKAKLDMIGETARARVDNYYTHSRRNRAHVLPNDLHARRALERVSFGRFRLNAESMI
jgi:uncharacterized Rmd1/YagE family protein